MRAILTFTCPLIYAGGMVGPTEAVTGRVLVGTVLAAIWGYAISTIILDFTNRNKIAAPTPKE